MSFRTITLMALVLGLTVGPALGLAASNTVSGVVFQDLNQNGANNAEPGLSGATVTLDGTVSTTTGTSGAFSFGNVSDGSHQVCAAPPTATPAWVATTATCVQFSLSGGKLPASFVAAFGFKQEDGVQGCTRTQGYWGSAPAGEALLVTLVGGEPGGQMLLGSLGYTATELQAILDSSVSTPGPGSNALINLAHQLIAAKANRLNGASAPASVLNAIAAADVLIGSSDMSPVGSSPQIDPTSTTGQAMITQKDILDAYNNGNAEGGPSHCER